MAEFVYNNTKWTIVQKLENGTVIAEAQDNTTIPAFQIFVQIAGGNFVKQSPKNQ